GPAVVGLGPRPAVPLPADAAAAGGAAPRPPRLPGRRLPAGGEGARGRGTAPLRRRPGDAPVRKGQGLPAPRARSTRGSDPRTARPAPVTPRPEGTQHPRVAARGGRGGVVVLAHRPGRRPLPGAAVVAAAGARPGPAQRELPGEPGPDADGPAALPARLP